MIGCNGCTFLSLAPSLNSCIVSTAFDSVYLSHFSTSSDYRASVVESGVAWVVFERV